MNDPRAHWLITKRVKFNWVTLILLGACVALFGICRGTGDFFLIAIGGLLIISYGSFRTYKVLLAEGESYHVFSGFRLTKQSSFGLLLLCVVSELGVVATILLIFVVKSAAQC